MSDEVTMEVDQDEPAVDGPNGQKLAKVRRRKKSAEPVVEAQAEEPEESDPEPEEDDAVPDLRTIDDVARKHAADKEESPRQRALRERRERQAQRRAAEEEEAAASPEVEDWSDDGEVWTDDTPVPPGEADPARRDRMTIGAIEPEEGLDFPDTAGRGPPQNLQDICATYPIGSGTHYIRVERTDPKAYMNQRTCGFLGEIRSALSERQFADYYGGGSYVLTVYGPDPKGRHDPQTGLPKIKALTKQVKFTVPGNPNLDIDIDDEPGRRRPPPPTRDGMDWENYAGRVARRGPPPTSAEASMHRENLSFARSVVEDSREEARRAREEASKGFGNVEPIIGAVRGTAEQTIAMMREQEQRREAQFERMMQQKEEELRELRGKVDQLVNKPSESSTAWDAMARMASSMSPGQRSTEEMARIHESHRDEMRRAADMHASELSRSREHYEGALRAKDAQLDELRRMQQEELRRAKDEQERRERDIKEEAERRVRDGVDRHAAELQRIREDHDRELKALERQHQLVLETRKVSFETQLASLAERYEIAKEERERAVIEKSEAEDFVSQLEKFEQRAGVLGYSKSEDSAPRDWKERIASAFGHALMNADKIAESFGRAVQAKQEQAIVQQQRQLPPPQQESGRQIRGAGGRIGVRRPSWASDDGAPDAAEHQYVGPTQAAEPPRPAPPPPPPPASAAAASAPSPANGQTNPAQAAPPPPTPSVSDDPIGAEERAAREAFLSQIDQLRVFIERSIEAGREPKDFVADLLKNAGPDVLRQVVHQISADQLISALSEDPKTASASPIVRPNGQKWLRKAWQLAKDAVAVPAPQAQSH